MIKQGSKPHFLCTLLSEITHVIHMMIVTIWEVILWNEPENLWSLSRPLLPLILLDQAFFQQYVQALCSEQPAVRQESFRNVRLILFRK